MLKRKIRRERDYMHLNHSKKGNMVLDAIVILIALVAFGLISLYATGLMGSVTSEITADSEFGKHAGEANASAELTALDARMPHTLDSAFGIVFGLLFIFVIVSAFLLDSHPAFFIISLVLFIGVLIAAGFLNEMYTDIITDEAISGEISQFPITNFVLDHLMIVILVIGVAIGVALYAKSQ